jgi:hypothetical protein
LVFIRAVCKNSVGHEFIERGDFRVLHIDKFIDPLEFANYVVPGMIIEMSIELQQEVSVSNAEKCPRCGYINIKSISVGWIEWEVSSISVISTSNDIICTVAV